MVRRLGLALTLVLALAAAYLFAAYHGWLGRLESPGAITTASRPAADLAREARTQAAASAAIGAGSEKQVLFGDLHVHTTYSVDAFLTSLPIMQGEGAHPQADACDFARFCAALDFYSINDHAEGLTPDKWGEIKESIRQCNAVSGDPESPDLAAFLGFEWTQMSRDPATHFGHKNVIFRDTEDDRVPTRPIRALGFASRAMRRPEAARPLIAMSLVDFSNRQRYFDMVTFVRSIVAAPLCEADVPVRELPASCSEGAATPRELFDKLDDWGYPAMVIPHGNAWGNTTPAGIDWEKQLAERQHDPRRQTLIEVASGHGSSEEYRPWRHVETGPDGELRCPAPSPGFTPDCHRAGEIIRQRCQQAGEPAAVCEDRAVQARARFLAAGRAGGFVVPGAVAEDWLDAGQCTDCFEPAFLYRPGGSSQYALAVSGAGVPGAEDDQQQRFRFGFIASSDNHTARPSSGYKEFTALGMTDALDVAGFEALHDLVPVDRTPVPESRPIDPDDIPLLPGGDERLNSFFYTGGLVAVHAEGRDRGAIWQALSRKEVYGTSGPRILLWFDLLDESGQARHPMGSEVELGGTPRFRVRAVGSLEQQPGCPESARAALGPERLKRLCMDECHHPGDRRRLISRIEVVRIRPRLSRDEDVAGLIDDPWRSFDCPPSEAGCSFEFEDPEYEASGRDHVYYARVLEEPSRHVNGDPLRCERDEQGRCIATRPCRPGASRPDEQCLSDAQARAWSSPIFVDQPRR